MWKYGVRKIQTSFKTLASNKTTIWWLKKSHNSDKLLEKITSSSYHMESALEKQKIAAATYEGL